MQVGNGEVERGKDKVGFELDKSKVLESLSKMTDKKDEQQKLLGQIQEQFNIINKVGANKDGLNSQVIKMLTSFENTMKARLEKINDDKNVQVATAGVGPLKPKGIGSMEKPQPKEPLHERVKTNVPGQDGNPVSVLLNFIEREMEFNIFKGIIGDIGEEVIIV